MRAILPLIYVIIGAVIAQQHHYFAHVNSIAQVASAALAIVLWPLILFQVNLHIK
ncbi:MAG: hypothetical protein ACR2HD_08650 [Solirubrobacteraceae bacterium]